MDKERDARRLDYVWAAIVAKNYLDGIREEYAPDQSADSAVKRADQAEHAVGKGLSPDARDPLRRLDWVWALVAADEFQRQLERTVEPSGSAIAQLADRAVEEVSHRPSISYLLKKQKKS